MRVSIDIYGLWMMKVGLLTLHDVVHVENKPGANCNCDDSQLPDGNGGLSGRDIASLPGGVNRGPRADGVPDIIGAVGERCGAGSDDLDKRVPVLDLVRVLFSVRVYALHAGALRRARDAGLCGMNIIVHTIECTGNDHSRNPLYDNDHIAELVDLTCAYGIVVEDGHGPAKGTFGLPKLGMESLLTFRHELLIGGLCGLNLSDRDVPIILHLVFSRQLRGRDVLSSWTTA